MKERTNSISPKCGWGKILSLLLILTMVAGFVPATMITAEAYAFEDLFVNGDDLPACGYQYTFVVVNKRGEKVATFGCFENKFDYETPAGQSTDGILTGISENYAQYVSLRDFPVTSLYCFLQNMGCLGTWQFTNPGNYEEKLGMTRNQFFFDDADALWATRTLSWFFSNGCAVGYVGESAYLDTVNGDNWTISITVPLDLAPGDGWKEYPIRPYIEPLIEDKDEDFAYHVNLRLSDGTIIARFGANSLNGALGYMVGTAVAPEFSYYAKMYDKWNFKDMLVSLRVLDGWFWAYPTEDVLHTPIAPYCNTGYTVDSYWTLDKVFNSQTSSMNDTTYTTDNQTVNLTIAGFNGDFGGLITADGFEIHFDANGGTFKDDNSTSKDIKQIKDTPYNLPANPERDGYDFVGWGVAKDSTTAANLTGNAPAWSSSVPTKYYAIWKAAAPTTYTIKMSDGGDYHIMLGEWANDNSYNLDFTAKATDDTSAPVDGITVTTAFDGAFKDKGYKVSDFLTVSGAAVNGDEFRVTVTPPAGRKSVRSCIVKITISCNGDSADYTIVVPGDVNASGTINSADVTEMLQAINGTKAPTKEAADHRYELMNINGSGNINAGDATIALRMVNNIITAN